MNYRSVRSMLSAAVLLLCVINSTAAAQSYPKWLDSSVFYQIYPSSYMDSDGNGIGDINGIISPDIKKREFKQETQSERRN